MFEPSKECGVVRGLQVLRVEAGHATEVTLQSDAPELLVTHWFNRQYVCPGEGCPACGTYQSRVTAFFVVTVAVGVYRQARLIELSVQSLSRLRFMAAWDDGEFGSGWVVRLSRRHRRAAVLAEPLSDGGEISPKLCDGGLLLDALGCLLKLPPRRVEESAEDWCDRIQPFCVAQLEHAIRAAG